MKIALAQVNPTVGDLEANAALVVEHMRAAEAAGAEVVAFPELVISGYPPEDLLLKGHFLAKCWDALLQVAEANGRVCALLGAPMVQRNAVYNAAVVVRGGRVAGVYRKMCLANYAVFDERRYFTPGDHIGIVDLGGMRMGLNICEDIWEPCGPAYVAAVEGQARLVINLSMSPYHVGKGRQRETMLARRARSAGCYVAYVNGVGGQDELVFDGQSLVLAPDGSVLARARQFEEQLLLVDIDLDTLLEAKAGERAGEPPEVTPAPDEAGTPCTFAGGEIDVMVIDTACGAELQVDAAAPVVSLVSAAPGAAAPEAVTTPGAALSGTHPCLVSERLSPEAEVYAALRLAVRDYVRKNRFRQVVVGVSGGVDSALTACIAVDAIGEAQVNAVSMPSRYSSSGTQTDARETAGRLGVHFSEISIETIYQAYLDTLAPLLGDGPPGVTEQNIQARIRGNLLMAMSNKFGYLVLTTGNKSETAVGYATLYGDMAGGFAVLKDVPKTLVYRLAEYRNSLGPGDGPIPRTTIDRAPSAELAAGQTDQDTLPPYHLLDSIVEAYVVNDRSAEEIAATGIGRDKVERVLAMIDGNEYKRRQAPLGVRITPKAFGKDRRLPVTNRFHG